MKKRLLSWLMVLTLCLTLLPTAALAAGPEDGADEVQDEQQLPEQPVEETKQEQQPVEESKQEEQEESGDAVQAAQHGFRARRPAGDDLAHALVIAEEPLRVLGEVVAGNNHDPVNPFAALQRAHRPPQQRFAAERREHFVDALHPAGCSRRNDDGGAG